MYDGVRTTVKSAAGLTKKFKVGVGLYQGSAVSSFLFSIIVDRLTEDIRKDTPWDILFADDRVLCRQNHRELEEDLEIWRNALERRGLKVSRSKTEYLRVGDVDDGEELKLQGKKVKRASVPYTACPACPIHQRALYSTSGTTWRTRSDGFG